MIIRDPHLRFQERLEKTAIGMGFGMGFAGGGQQGANVSTLHDRGGNEILDRTNIPILVRAP